MLKSIAKYAAELAVLLVLSSAVIFLLVSASPIDPITSNYGQVAASKMSAAKIASLKEYWGVGKPVFERLAAWISQVLQGNLGESLIYNEPVTDVIARGIANSLPVLTIAWLLSGLFGYSLGLYSEIKTSKLSVKILDTFNFVLMSSPTYWIAILLLVVFSINLGWINVGSTNAIESAVLPCIVLTLSGIPVVFFHTKTKCKEILKSDYVDYAKANGLTTNEIFKKHVIKNASFPFISIQFAQIAEIIGGSVVVEQVFSFPGLGYVTVNAACGSDVTLLAGISLVTCVIVFLGTFLANTITVLLDPRLKRNKVSNADA